MSPRFWNCALRLLHGKEQEEKGRITHNTEDLLVVTEPTGYEIQALDREILGLLCKSVASVRVELLKLSGCGFDQPLTDVCQGVGVELTVSNIPIVLSYPDNPSVGTWVTSVAQPQLNMQ